ncbi:alpha/beta-tubulin-N-acetyltransferase 9 [Xenentodon cancila]
MRINENTLLEGQNVLLVPYNSEHVPRYHEWMKSAELQQLTASEPLTLQQEYDMQRSWREDDDKCTFIILDKQRWADPSVEVEQCMVGDVNIFLTDPTEPSLAELEVMIAEQSYRGRGIGKEVTRMMMCYGLNKLGIKRFQAKIGLDNQVSVSMFKKLHFKEVSVSDVFREVTLELSVNEAVRLKLQDDVAHVKERDYRQTCSRRQDLFSQGGVAHADGVKSSVIRERLGVESLLLHVKRSQTSRTPPSGRASSMSNWEDAPRPTRYTPQRSPVCRLALELSRALTSSNRLSTCGQH